MHCFRQQPFFCIASWGDTQQRSKARERKRMMKGESSSIRDKENKGTSTATRDGREDWKEMEQWERLIKKPEDFSYSETGIILMLLQSSLLLLLLLYFFVVIMIMHRVQYVNMHDGLFKGILVRFVVIVLSAACTGHTQLCTQDILKVMKCLSLTRTMWNPWIQCCTNALCVSAGRVHKLYV